MKLLVLLVVLALRRMEIAWPDWLMARDRIARVQSRLTERLASLSMPAFIQWLLLVLVPVLLVALVLHWLHGFLWGLPGFIVGGLLLLWLLGGESELRQLDDLLVRGRMNDPEKLAEASGRYFEAPGEPDQPGFFPGLLERIVHLDLRQLFAITFWLIALGYWAALLYALNLQRLRDAQGQEREIARVLHTALIWIPSRLLVLCMALGGNFRRVADSVTGRIWQLDSGEDLLRDALAGALDVPELNDPESLQAGIDQLEALQGVLMRCLAMWLILAAVWVVVSG